MRNIRAVYQKLRDVKYHHLVKFYKKHMKRIPDNCKYNYPYNVSANTTVHLCFLHQPNLNLESGIFPHLIDVCQELHHCSSCNGFIPQYTKKEIQELFLKELENKKFKEKKYPDICALEWVLEQSVLGIPPLNIIQKIYFYIKKFLSKNKIL